VTSRKPETLRVEAIMQKLIVDVAIAGAIVCLVVYVVLTLAPVILAWAKYKAPAKAGAGRRTIAAVPLTGISDLVKAFATLVDSLVKASPALTSLIGSMLFLLIAAAAAGLFA
jgi:HAMP domain-containing protein